MTPAPLSGAAVPRSPASIRSPAPLAHPDGAACLFFWSVCRPLEPWLAGGGIRGGVAHGASDRIGAYPSTNPVLPQDLMATIYHCLGIDPATEVYDPLRRPLPIAAGSPITAIFG